MVNLGFMELPLTGPMGFVHACGGMFVGAAATIGVIMYALSQHPVLLGPAIDVKSISIREACNGAILASCGWIIVYYNMVGANVVLVMCTGPWKMIPADKVDMQKFMSAPPRFSGNSAEHAVVFMTALWMYTIFVDATTGGILGMAYVIQRAIYPWCYMLFGGFTFYFEYVTQAGYGFIGVMVVGSIVNATGGDWVGLLTKQPAMYAFMSWLAAELSLLPALPLGVFYAPMHYALHRCLHFQGEGYSQVK
jgi:hypothetical protein